MKALVADIQTVQIEGRVFRLPFLDQVRPLTPVERERLRMSIEVHGIQAPVLIDESDHVIDGASRLTLAAEVGVPLSEVPLHVVAGLSWEEKEALSWQLNEDRRQLTAADLETARAKRNGQILEKRAEGKSERLISQELDVPRSTVSRVLTKDAGPRGPEPREVNGTDGKKHKAAKPKRKKPDAEQPSSLKAEMLDEEGGQVPERLQPIFAVRFCFDDALSKLRDVAATINELRESSAGAELRPQAEIDRKNCYQAIKHARPHAICPHCKAECKWLGKPCEVCRGNGWVVKGTFDRYQDANKGK